MDVYSATSLPSNPCADMSFQSDTLSCFLANRSLLLLINAVCVYVKWVIVHNVDSTCMTTLLYYEGMIGRIKLA
jgi:hypothetical protein